MVFLHLKFCTNRSRFQRWLSPCIPLELKFLIFFPNFKIMFIVIVWLCAHSVFNHCSFSKNVIRCGPVGDIHRPSNSGSGGLEMGAFIQCVNCGEPQIHELWYHVIGGICREVHPYTRIDIPAGTGG